MARISSLHTYPIKSCAGTSLTRAAVTNKGFRNDRHWMVVDSDGVFLTQRQLPKLALVRPEIQTDVLLLARQGDNSPIELSIDGDGPKTEVWIWGNACTAIEDGKEAAMWLSDHLDVECRLVHMHTDFVRAVPNGDARLEFADSYPLLIVSEGSLEDLNSRIEQNGGQSIPIDRFRPNIVIDASSPFEEDSWANIQIGGLEYVLAEHAVRCVTTTVNQATGESGREPLRTLAQYRRAKHQGKSLGVIFGQRASNLDTGHIQVDMDVEVLKYKDPSDFSGLVASTS